MKLDELMRRDRRARRAMAFVGAVMRVIDNQLRDRILDDPEDRVIRDIYEELTDLCRKEGVEILTDRIREDIGLPPRGPDGWTMEELLALEQRNLEVMRAPIVMQPVLATK